jgi:DNA invertase Pin-like site-specific DNA recombinase
VVYAAKSSEDLRGSIPAQLADCREAIAAMGGREVVAERSDEARTAYRGNRGPGLEAAKRDAIAAARRDGLAELWVQHSDRLARGDGRTADHLAEVFFAMRKARVRLRSVQDDANLEDAIRAVLIGERNHEDSSRKSAATRSGKRRRFETGHAVGGPVNDGYRLVPQVDESGRPRVQRDGRIVYRREPDPERAPLIERIFDLVEQGHTFGDVSRLLNSELQMTRTGRRWTTRGVREIVLNPYYAGWIVMSGERVEGTHPAVIDRERWDRIQASRRRVDPVALQRRKGGRRAADEYILRGIAHCARCGSPLYVHRQRGKRFYVCREIRQCTGLCTARPIPAELLEAAVVADLKGLVPRMKAWLAEKATERAHEHARLEALGDAERQRLGAIVREAEALRTNYRKHLLAGSELADLALAELHATEQRADAQRAAVTAAEARVQEWTTAPTMDEALDYLIDVRDIVVRRLGEADGPIATRGALAELLEAVRADATGGGRWRERIRASMTLRVPAALEDTQASHRDGLRRRIRPWEIRAVLFPEEFDGATWHKLVADGVARSEPDDTRSCRSTRSAGRSPRRTSRAP